jgi:hypothetical protein
VLTPTGSHWTGLGLRGLDRIRLPPTQRVINATRYRVSSRSPLTWKDAVRRRWRAAGLIAAMGNIPEIVCGSSVGEQRRLNRRDHHSRSAMRTGKKEGREA